MEWLGLGPDVFLQRETENAGRDDGKALHVFVSPLKPIDEDPIVGFFFSPQKKNLNGYF